MFCYKILFYYVLKAHTPTLSPLQMHTHTLQINNSQKCVFSAAVTVLSVKHFSNLKAT